MEKDTLYEKDQIKITYFHSPERGKEKEVISAEDHELWTKERGREYDNRYILQRGVLRELADVAVDNSPSLIRKLNTINEFILHETTRVGISLDDLRVAFIGASKKEVEDFEAYLSEQKRL